MNGKTSSQTYAGRFNDIVSKYNCRVFRNITGLDEFRKLNSVIELPNS
jgi:hypothetical protein